MKFTEKDKERNKSICVDILNGESMRVVGLRYGVSTERTRQIQTKMMKMIDYDMYKKSIVGWSCSTAFLREHKNEIIPKVIEL